MTENCRVKMARFFVGTFVPFLAAAFAFAAAAAGALAALAWSIRVTMI